MCGIVCFFANKSVPDKMFFDILFTEAEIRGQDGFSISILTKPDYTPSKNFKSFRSYSDVRDEALDFVIDNLKVDDIVLAIARNAPETESITTIDSMNKTLQPIFMNDITYVHNGAISETIVAKYKDQMKTELDSESIGLSYYENQKNIKRTLESITGGWSLVMVDASKKKIIIGSSFLPLAHGYDFTAGFVVHSSSDAIRKAFGYLRGLDSVKFTRIWEDFYVDELLPYHIYEVDIDSGLTRDYDYQHNFSINIVNRNRSKYLVASSSGIDSTVTLLHLLKQGHNVEAIHFMYGQKSEEAELMAFKNIVNELHVQHRIIDLGPLFQMVKKHSMLLDESVEITTGKNIKSVDAWVPNRNGIFLNVLAMIAEDLITNNNFDKVYLSAGFPNISEESVYPDNSQRFVDSFLNTVKYSTLVGTRIHYTNPMQGLTKTEELQLMKYYDAEYLFGLTVSCDNAKVIDNKVYQCSKNNIPACGSGILSWLAAKKVGIKDTRLYYEVSQEVEVSLPNYVNQTKFKDVKIEDILKRIKS
ncbi:MAG: 7-cyano-7-deazaguanine synthase [Conexivisphaerales archaeon]